LVYSFVGTKKMYESVVH